MVQIAAIKDKLIRVGNKIGLHPSCCCDKFEYAILTCNANSVTDDNFDVFLNGTNIGTHIGAQNTVVNGSFWSTDNAITRQLLTCANCIICDNDPEGSGATVENELCDACANSPNIVDKVVQKKLFIQGNNTLEMINTQMNQAGNYGRVWVFRFKKNPPALDAILVSSEYTGPDGANFGPYNFNI